MKKEYVEPQIVIDLFLDPDVIACSGNIGENPEDPDPDNPGFDW